MLVREIMHSPVISVDAQTSLSSAYAAMHRHGIRHLPVLSGGTLAGIVTDRDLRLATSALHPSPFPADAFVEQIMTRDPITAAPLDPVEEAARIMLSRKIGCLPVMEGDKLVGIVTGPDLLDAIVRLTGLTRPTGRLAVRLSNDSGELTRLTSLIDRQGVSIYSILSYHDREDTTKVILRVNTLNTRTLADSLRTEGFDVAWPPRKAWSN